ncbi:hypothetical protein QTI66_01465 [Variovorax sp. J22R133]|uniref:hypothetical protein n=1 Tax=Variovorax brevis TaxID=3053503 RepID=UPI002575FF40|nr:hypothetical protein [Variovorax sp. J22R133]MDM0110794.1 hypothetical protein [Variovorax sp. J22R133]
MPDHPTQLLRQRRNAEVLAGWAGSTLTWATATTNSYSPALPKRAPSNAGFHLTTSIRSMVAAGPLPAIGARTEHPKNNAKVRSAAALAHRRTWLILMACSSSGIPGTQAQNLAEEFSHDESAQIPRMTLTEQAYFKLVRKQYLPAPRKGRGFRKRGEGEQE